MFLLAFSRIQFMTYFMRTCTVHTRFKMTLLKLSIRAQKYIISHAIFYVARRSLHFLRHQCVSSVLYLESYSTDLSLDRAEADRCKSSSL